MRRTIPITAAALALALAQGVAAEQRIGRTIGVTCAGCHGTDGISRGDAPSLRGKSAAFLADTLLEFKSGTREASIMNRIAKGYTDEQIRAVADYFAAMK